MKTILPLAILRALAGAALGALALLLYLTALLQLAHWLT